MPELWYNSISQNDKTGEKYVYIRRSLVTLKETKLMKSYNDEYKLTSNSSVYAKAKKRVYESTCKINCSICSYHKGENITSWKRHTNWKRNRKTQYKGI